MSQPFEVPQDQLTGRRRARFTALNGNELYCIDRLGFEAGDLVVGNSIFSMGLLGSLRSAGRSALGGELTQVTGMILEGRKLALHRLEAELRERSAIGVAGVRSDLIQHVGNIEFLSIGSALHTSEHDRRPFTTSADGQQLYCQVDAGYIPMKFVFGNVAYSMGVGGGIMGAFRGLAKGEVTEYSQIFHTTRHLALRRLEDEARQAGANCVVDVQTSILPFGGAHEMSVTGTASHCSALQTNDIATAALTNQELWTVTQMGFQPVKYLLATSVYSMGLMGGIKSAFKNFVKGEINELTRLIYDAREQTLARLDEQATAVDADDVLGVQMQVHHVGSGVIEMVAVGTAVKKVGKEVAKTRSDHLPAQAIVHTPNFSMLTGGLDLELGE